MDIEVPAALATEFNQILHGYYDAPLPSEPSIVLDIGANVGCFTLWALSKWPDCHVYAYEPASEVAKKFKKNVPYDHVNFINAAVRGFTGKDKLHYGQNNIGEASFHDIDHQSEDTEEVDCIDAKSLPAAEFIKIDTEGCELEILQGLDLSKAQAISLEYHRAEDQQKIIEYLRPLGFYVHHHRPQREGLGVLKLTRRIVHGQCFLAVPIYCDVPGYFQQTLLNIALSPPCPIAIRPCIGDSLVTRARNTLSADFLQSDCSHVLFIDSDLIFSSEHVYRLMQHKEDLVGGLYPKKQTGPVQWVCNACDYPTTKREDGLQEVKYIGSGFMRISRHVFDSMIERYGDSIKYKPDHNIRDEYDFWPVGPYRFANGYIRYLSEDWYFCQRWADLGGKIWADTRSVAKHIGQAIYPL